MKKYIFLSLLSLSQVGASQPDTLDITHDFEIKSKNTDQNLLTLEGSEEMKNAILSKIREIQRQERKIKNHDLTRELHSDFILYINSNRDYGESFLQESKKNKIMNGGPYHFVRNILQRNSASLTTFSAAFKAWTKASLEWEDGDEPSKEPLLQTLLQERLDDIMFRKLKIYDAKTKHDGKPCLGRYFILPTDPDSYKRLKPELRLCVDIMIDHYQFLNKMILTLAKEMDLKTLSPATANLLKASVSLHDRIKNGFDDLGHPDEALTKNTKGSLPKEPKDSDFYSYYFNETEVIRLPSYSSFYKSSDLVSFFVTPCEADRHAQRDSAMPDLPDPSFLKKKKGPLPLELTQPEPTPEKAQQSEDLNEKIETKLPVTDQKTSPAFKASKEIIPPAPIQEEETKPAPDLLPTEVSSHETPSTMGHEKESEIISPIGNRSQTSKRKSISPKRKKEGVLFEFIRDEKKTVKNPFAQLKTKHVKILDDIFENKKLSDVTFQRFTTLWEALGGVIPKKKGGGSHRTLMYNHQVVGGTYVPHGGHNYGKRSIDSLRNALKAIGYEG